MKKRQFMKKFFALCIAAALSISSFGGIIPKTVYAQEANQNEQENQENNENNGLISEDLYTIDEQTGIITSYLGDRSLEEIRIPSTVKGINVIGIGEKVFSGMNNLKSIYLPDNIEKIGSRAFENCNLLSKIIPCNDEGNPIYECDPSILGICIPTKLSELASDAFLCEKTETNDNLDSSIFCFTVPDANEYFSVYSSQIENAPISEEQSFIGVTGPAVVVDEEVINITEVKVLGTQTADMLLSKDRKNLYKIETSHRNYSKINIPYGVESIGACAGANTSFGGANVRIPETVTSIGDYGFYASNLNDFNITFEGISRLTGIGAHAFQYLEKLNGVFPNSLTSIGEYSFANIQNYGSLDISKTSIVVIPQYAFAYNATLAELSLPATVKIVQDYAFTGSGNLTTVNFLGESLDSLGKGAFQDCRTLNNIEIPEGVTTIQEDTFSGCGNLSKVVLPETLTTIEENAFKGDSTIHELVIPKNVTSIAANSFEGVNTEAIDTSKNAYAAAAIKGVQLKALPSAINVPTVTKEVLPQKGKVFTLGKLKYKILKSAKKGGKVSVLKAKSKKNKTIKIPATVKYENITFKVSEIAKSAFSKNKKLKNVVIGKNIEKIGSKAFYKDKKLKKIKILSKKLKSIGKNAIKGIHKKAKIKVPKKKKKAYKKKFKKKTGFKKSMKIN